MNKKALLLVCLFVAIFTGLIVLFLNSGTLIFSKSPSISLQQNPEVIREEWRSYMKEVGIEKAYLDFKKVYVRSAPFFQHSHMHVIGSLIFQEFGLEGVVYCDESFMFGCFHGFFGEAFAKSGLEDLHRMDDLCIEKYGEQEGACQHGMGHGILVYIGNEKLKKALDICSTLKWRYKIGGCKAGVYMEYNFSNVTHTVQKIRELVPDNPNFPCNELKEVDQYGCYFAQADWWDSVYKADYKKIGELCEQLLEDNKEACYLGTGNVALQSSRFRIEPTLQKCDAIASEYGNLLCKAAARWIYLLNIPQHNLPYESSEIFCNTVDASMRDTCTEKSELVK